MPAKYTATYKSGFVSGTTLGTAEGSTLPTLTGYDYNLYFYYSDDTTPYYFLSTGQISILGRTTAPSGDYVYSTGGNSVREYKYTGGAWVFQSEKTTFISTDGFRFTLNSYGQSKFNEIHNNEIVNLYGLYSGTLDVNDFPLSLTCKRTSKSPL